MGKLFSTFSGTGPGSAITGSGSANQVAVFNGASSITGDSTFTYDLSSKALTFGSDTSSHTFIGNTIHFQRTGGDCHLDIECITSGEPALYWNQANRDWIFGVTSAGVLTLNRGSSLAAAPAMTFNTGGSMTIVGDVTIGANATTPTHAINTAVAATAGIGGSVLPATPEGFIVMTVNGTARKIPYYPSA